MAVRPLHPGSGHFFTTRDLRAVRKFNPFLQAIGGHSVVPHSDLLRGPEQIKFITQLRDPVARAVSHYRFRVRRMNKQPDPAEFLRHDSIRNFQVRKIAGKEDLTLAKDILREHFLLAGTVHQFDEFLVLLAKKLCLPLEMFTYSERNVASSTAHQELPGDFTERLRERNELDRQLCEWIESDLWPEQIAEYPGNFTADLEQFQSLQKATSQPITRPLIDSIYRNTYIKPVTGMIRLWNGLPYSGSYAHRKSRQQ